VRRILAIPSVNDTATLINLPWRANAACRGLDPAIFYPVTDEEAQQAKSVCDLCPVQSLCLEHALGIREKEGVWGGCTERERRRIIRQRRRTA
jgi:WhiB family redox-sensing transcriptional regulator